MAKGLKVPCLFVIRGEYMLSKKPRRLVYAVYPRIPPNTPLLVTINDLAKSIDESSQIDAVLLNFSKSFDKVSHSHLLLKIRHYSIKNFTLSWITDFLSIICKSLVPCYFLFASMISRVEFVPQFGCLLMTACCTIPSKPCMTPTHSNVILTVSRKG